MSQCMPTGMGLPLLMFLKQSLYHILYQVLREKCAIWNRSWPERQNTWFMSWPCFYTAEWSYAKKQLNPSRALFPTHKRHKNKNGKSRKNLWIKYLLRSISMYRMEMYLGFWDWILKLWRKYLCNFGRSATEQTGIIPHRLALRYGSENDLHISKDTLGHHTRKAGEFCRGWQVWMSRDSSSIEPSKQTLCYILSNNHILYSC